MSKVILVHGWNVWDDGAGTVGRLRPFLESYGHEVYDYAYGWRFILRMRDWFGKTTQGLREAIQQSGAEVAIGHSNGCYLINEATHRGSKIRKVIYMNPALDSDMPLAPQIDEAHVFYSPDDYVTKIAELLLFHGWGAMGTEGYTGYDGRYHNHSYYSYVPNEGKLRHSDAFDHLDILGPAIARFAR